MDLENLKGYCHDNFEKFSIAEIDPEPLVQNEKHFCNHKRKISRDSSWESKPVYFSGDTSHSKFENVRITFSSCSPYLTVILGQRQQ